MRLATAMSDGDVSLAENTRFRNFKKRERKNLLSLLENAGNITEDMLRHNNRWKRLGERLHPFEYAQEYPRCADAFDVIRNNKPFVTFSSEVEQKIKYNNINGVLPLLLTRPGEFARRLDKLLRSNK